MEPLLKDLCVLIRKSSIHYNETCEQGEVVLTEEFQAKYGDYLRQHNYIVDFYKYTAVITTPVGHYMFVPNQWFVIASYAVGVYLELIKYKNYLFQVCDVIGEKPKIFIPNLRDDTPSVDKSAFEAACCDVFVGASKEEMEIATRRLWRFSTDYSWWSGNKTVDRGDFYLSVILNMLELVNASQSYVGEIVADYCDGGFVNLVSDLSLFTESSQGSTFIIEDYIDPKIEVEPDEKTSKKIDNNDLGDEIVISVRRKE